MWTSLSRGKPETKVAIIARLANSIANQHPDDKDAQWRAQTARAFLQDFGITPQSTAAGSSNIIPVSPSEPQHAVKLPAELYRMIVGYVDSFRHPSRSREPTLVALSCTSKILNTFAEEFIYKHPGNLRPYYKQLKFLFSLRIRPTRATLVRSLILDWHRLVENDHLERLIIASCPNVDFLSMGYGSVIPQTICRDQLDEFQFILGTCTRMKSFHYDTDLRNDGGGGVRMRVARTQNYLSDWVSGHTHVKQSLKQLENLGLNGYSSWILQASLQYLSCNLTSVQLGWGTVLDHSNTPLFDMSQQCQKLKVLAVSCSLDTTEDLEKACRAWASTLERLKIDQVAGNKDWISETIPHLRKLKVLSLGIRCYVSVDGVSTIADAEMALESISMMNVEGLYSFVQRETHIASDAANEALADMIEAHSSTLRHVNIFPCVGRIVIRACKKAKSLRSLDMQVPVKTPSPVIDGLLDSCPELVDFPAGFEVYSYRRSEWEGRKQFRMGMGPLREVLLEGHIFEV